MNDKYNIADVANPKKEIISQSVEQHTVNEHCVDKAQQDREKMLDEAVDQFARLFLQQALRMRAEKAERENNNNEAA